MIVYIVRLFINSKDQYCSVGKLSTNLQINLLTATSL